MINFEHPINKKTALLLIWQFSQTLFIIMQSFESKRFYDYHNAIFPATPKSSVAVAMPNA